MSVSAHCGGEDPRLSGPSAVHMCCIHDEKNPGRGLRGDAHEEVEGWARGLDLLGDSRPELIVLMHSGELRVLPTPGP